MKAPLHRRTIPSEESVKDFSGCNRHQIVKNNSSSSNVVSVRRGAIQVFINDICESLRGVFISSTRAEKYAKLHGAEQGSTVLSKMASKCGWICFGVTSLNLDLTINGEVLSRLHTVVDLSSPTTCRLQNRLWNNLSQSIRKIKPLPFTVHCIIVWCTSEKALNILAPVISSSFTSEIIGTLNV
ncbi:hypothetical protein MS3_00001807 [Schistosoma haematobium]|uniref:Uncharacterized protein n=1 Tax=Schistosoma haematobium TaxID=6185 RepID=A0A6A5DI17_SCHHA|nr:hypothetical protein MS3_00001807 [Schistosoma haematobium]KAH9595946.1 hypothetical protein MS3_00001807 [Schistosoma haematobium]